MKVPSDIHDTIFPFCKYGESLPKWGKWPSEYYVYSSHEDGIKITAFIDPRWSRNKFEATAKLTIFKCYEKGAQVKENEYTFKIENVLNNKKVTEDEKEKYKENCIETIVKNMNAILATLNF